MAVNRQSKGAAPEPYTLGSVNSSSGVTIGYRQLGHGPGIVVLHGAASSGYNHLQLAEALAEAFTIYLPDRGRGLSDPFGQDYSIQTEVENLNALLARTDTHAVFGVSSGAIILLQAALTLPAIQKVAIYEPPLLVKDPVAGLQHFDEQMEQRLREITQKSGRVE